MSNYARYMESLKRGVEITKWILNDIAHLPLNDFDRRIENCDKLINYFQDIKRDLLFFKNVAHYRNPTPPTDPGNGPGAA